MERLREGKIYSGTVEGYTSEGQGVVRLAGGRRSTCGLPR